MQRDRWRPHPQPLGVTIPTHVDGTCNSPEDVRPPLGIGFVLGLFPGEVGSHCPQWNPSANDSRELEDQHPSWDQLPHSLLALTPVSGSTSGAAQHKCRPFNLLPRLQEHSFSPLLPRLANLLSESVDLWGVFLFLFFLLRDELGLPKEGRGQDDPSQI